MFYDECFYDFGWVDVEQFCGFEQVVGCRMFVDFDVEFMCCGGILYFGMLIVFVV